MTSVEKILWEELPPFGDLRRANKLGVHFPRQQVVQGFVVDFYCHRAELVVEVDGDVHDLQKEEDERREKVLSALGLRVVRYKNDEVMRSLSAVVGKIREAIQFVDLFTRSHTQARKAGLTEEYIRSAVKKARKR